MGRNEQWSFQRVQIYLTRTKVSVSITKQFTKVNLKVCLITNPQSGLFDIAVNGKPVQTINLYSEHAAFPVIEIGSFSPVNNAFEIIFTRKDNKTDAGETLLGIDYFIVK